MMNVATRLLIMGAFVVVIYIGANLLGKAGMPTEVGMPSRDLREMPHDFGSWKGKDAAMDPEVFEGTGAMVSVDRIYRNHEGDEIRVYVAVWKHREDQPPLPHLPRYCYPAAGYQITHSRDVQWQGTRLDSLPARLLALEREGRVLSVVYWYQIGDCVAVDRNGGRQARLRVRGNKAWPPIVKVILEIPARDTDQTVDVLESLAMPVFEWTNQL